MQPLLIEIGTEEMPAGISLRIGKSMQQAVELLLADARIVFGSLHLGVTPRRLLLHATACPAMQADRQETVWGPPARVAFNDGVPTKAAEGFARKVGVPLADFILSEKGDGKGQYMRAMHLVRGRAVTDILAGALPGILRKLPSPKVMRWQDGEARMDTFIRPVRWIVCRLGDAVVPFSFAGVASGKISIGHRTHGLRGELDVCDPFGWLSRQGVIADREQRKNMIREQLQSASINAGVKLLEDEELLEEVTDLTEWPQVLSGRYDEQFLRLPTEVSRIELKHHQRCFAARTGAGEMSNLFFAVANLKSKDPSVVVAGNERVVNARLADAAFYFDRDPEKSLEERTGSLNAVVFQEGLGMVGDQVQRIRAFVLDNANSFGVDANMAQRAAYLCKSDLTTGLVGEFPELQGYMGGIYARMNGEHADVAEAIAEHYRPDSAEGALPDSTIARAIGVSERIDRLLGYFHIGRVPTASTDPFGLRRAAIGLIRLLVDDRLRVDMTLAQVITEASKQWNQQRVTIAISEETRSQVYAFIIERLTGMAGSIGVSKSSIDAALNSSVEIPLYRIVKVANLLTHFVSSAQGQAVVFANKRIANLLKKAGRIHASVNQNLFQEEAEKNLFQALEKIENFGFPVLPAAQLDELAQLRMPVDQFFDNVMVMVDDEKLRNNRLALLRRLRVLFLKLADISRL